MTTFEEEFNVLHTNDMTRDVPMQILMNLLYRGGKLLIAGTSKSYKTFTLLHLAYCVANGLTWWKWKTVKSKVLYINFELFEGEIARRLDGIRAAVGEGNLDLIDVANLRGRLKTVEDLLKCSEKIKAKRYRLLIIDPAYKLLGHRSENDASEIADLLNKIEAIGQRANVAVAIAHRFAKGVASLKFAIDRMSGSGVWGRDPDALLVMTPHKIPDCFTIEVILRSFPPSDQFVIEFQFPIFTMNEVLDPGELQEAKKGPEQKYSDEMLALPFGKNGKELGIMEWLHALQVQGLNITRKTLYRRARIEGSPFKVNVRGKYEIREFGDTTRQV
jgi:hypothetical protein